MDAEQRVLDGLKIKLKEALSEVFVDAEQVADIEYAIEQSEQSLAKLKQPSPSLIIEPQEVIQQSPSARLRAIKEELQLQKEVMQLQEEIKRLQPVEQSSMQSLGQLDHIKLQVYCDFAKISKELVFPTSIITVKAQLVINDQIGKDNQASVSTARSLVGESYHVRFSQPFKFIVKASQQVHILLVVDITEGGGISETIGWTLIPAKLGQLKASCVEAPVRVAQYSNLTQLDDLHMYVRVQDSASVGPTTLNEASYGPKRPVSRQQILRTSRRNINSTPQKQVKFENRKVIASAPIQSQSKEMVFMARSMKTISTVVNLKVSFEKMTGLPGYAHKLKLQLIGLGDPLQLPDLAIKFSKDTLQLKEKAELMLKRVLIKSGAYVQFEVLDERLESLCWGKLQLFGQEDGSLVISKGVLDCQLFKSPVSEMPEKLQQASIWARVDDVDASGAALQAASGLTPISKEAWIPYKQQVDLDNMFEDSKGFALCIDGARFMPANALIPKVSAQIVKPTYQPSDFPKVETQVDLDTTCQMPVFMAVREYPTIVGDRTMTVLFKIRAYNKLNNQFQTFGFAMINLYTDSATMLQPDNNQDKSHLNAGAFQIPIYQGLPDVTQPLSMKSKYTPIPCATLLVRIVPLSELTSDFPLYGSGIYDSTQCTPSENEGLIYNQLIQSLSQQSQRDALQLKQSDSQISDWAKLKYSDQKKFDVWDYTHIVQYKAEYGIAFALDGCQNLPVKKMSLGVVQQDHCTTQFQFKSSVQSPVYLDGYWILRTQGFIVIEIMQVVDKKLVGWSIVPALNQTFAMHGRFQLPLLQGTPTKAILKKFEQHEYPLYALSELASQGVVKYVSGASALIRICDARRVDELSVKSRLDQRFLPTKLKQYEAISSSLLIQDLLKNQTEEEFRLQQVAQLRK